MENWETPIRAWHLLERISRSLVALTLRIRRLGRANVSH